MDPFETFVLQDRASSIVECGLINCDQKAQIFHPASIRIWKKNLSDKKKAVDLYYSAGIHKILWPWLFHSMQASCQTLQLFLQLRPHMGRQIFIQHFPFHGEQNLLMKQTNSEQTILMKQTNPVFEVQSFVGFTAHLIAPISVFKYSLTQDSFV